jgi:hypothetical protein
MPDGSDALREPMGHYGLALLGDWRGQRIAAFHQVDI